VFESSEKRATSSARSAPWRTTALSASPDQQHQGIHQQGFARAGFARYHGQAAMGRNLHFMGDRKIFDVEGNEHRDQGRAA
jgi:hypothetical protein